MHTFHEYTMHAIHDMKSSVTVIDKITTLLTWSSATSSSVQARLVSATSDQYLFGGCKIYSIVLLSVFASMSMALLSA